MKRLKKLTVLLLAVCLAVPCLATVTYAAGSIQFTDPSTKTGEVLEVTGAIKGGEVVEDATVSMIYDTSMLKFKGGENVTESAAGQLEYSVKNVGTDTIRFKMNFDVLKEGTAKIEVAEYTVYNTDDQKLDLQKGFSTITIAAGETPVTEQEQPTENPETAPAVGVEVTVGGKTYTFSSEFVETDIPAGFAETTMEFNGSQMNVVQQETSGICLGYLVDENMVGKFFLYNAEDATFSPFEQITISDATVITILTNSGSVELPKEYQKVTLTLNEQDFPVWQNMEHADYYVLYAVNNRGEKSLYQFDSLEGTYQRFEAPAVGELEEKEADTTFFGKLNSFLEKHLDYVILGTGLGFIFFLVLVSVLGVKLYNRNAELDELYDEYDIGVEEEEQAKEDAEEEAENDDFEDDVSLEEKFEDDSLFEDEEDDFIDEEEFADEEESFFDEDEEDDEKFEIPDEEDSSYEDFDVDFIDLDD